LAAQSGLAVLQDGGNAFDAAVATAAVLNVTEPMSTGVGGDAFALCFVADGGRILALNGSGRAPHRASLDALAADGLVERIPLDHPHSVTVPGAPRMWADLIAELGTRNLASLMRPAVRCAREGFAVSPLIAAGWERSAARLKEPAGGYLPGGEPPQVGQVVRMPDLADTLEAIGESGADAFYEGSLADRICRRHQELGGLLDQEDLVSHSSTWVDAISVEFDGLRVHQCPPNGQGLVVLQALGMLAQMDDLRHRGPAVRAHRMLEALRLAFADARRFVADPEWVDLPVKELLSEDYLSQRRASIRDEGRIELPEPGLAAPVGRDTVYLSVIDQWGNACSFINSLFHGFGSGIVVPGTGICLQNRGALFSLQAHHPNVLAPSKRPYHTIIPALSTDLAGRLDASFGVMGGFMQPQGQVQVLLHRRLGELDPQQSLDMPRLCIFDGDPAREIAYEPGIQAEILDGLRQRGHRLQRVEGLGRALFGGGQWLERNPESGVICGGSDPRKDGQVAAY
jgi:gamma-glutamyltranspeptidase/glutathione hydrolase